MAILSSYERQLLSFNFLARTSRGAMQQHISWIVKIWNDNNPNVYGLGECAPLPGLSIDDIPDFEDVLKNSLELLTKLNHVNDWSLSDTQKVISKEYPSIIFGIETALLDLQNIGERIVFKNNFIKGEKIPINGLIWMADIEEMLSQVDAKVNAGFHCIKIKVGRYDFNDEYNFLLKIRKKYPTITIRLDANGAFHTDDCLEKLNRLAVLNIHSIEQPIRQQQLSYLIYLCEKSPIPIVLDEELIGVHTENEKRTLLKAVRPAYIVLKPTLHGGMHSCAEWITIAEENNIGWWVTSALESNIGLNAICQFVANYPITLPQGLGTGLLYTNNICSPLCVDRGVIYYDKQRRWGV